MHIQALSREQIIQGKTYGRTASPQRNNSASLIQHPRDCYKYWRGCAQAIKANDAVSPASRAGRADQPGLGHPCSVRVSPHHSLMSAHTTFGSVAAASLCKYLQPSVFTALLPNKTCPEKPAVLSSNCRGSNKTSNTAGMLASPFYVPIIHRARRNG